MYLSHGEQRHYKKSLSFLSWNTLIISSNPQDLLIFTEEILNGKLHLLCNANIIQDKVVSYRMKKEKNVNSKI